MKLFQEQQAYNPQVEAISPTLPTDSLQEDASYRSTKDELLQQIGKVDREIAKAESQILKLKKKQVGRIFFFSLKYINLYVMLLGVI